MYNDASENLRRARIEINNAERYFDSLNHEIMINLIRTAHYPYEESKTNKEQNIGKFLAYIIFPIRAYLKAQQNEAERQEELDRFEGEMAGSSIILSQLRHRQRLIYLREVMSEDLSTVNKRWIEKIGDRYKYGIKPLDWDLN